jgi:hypothetical protein
VISEDVVGMEEDEEEELEEESGEGETVLKLLIGLVKSRHSRAVPGWS